ncbi:hypothetical protein EIN_267970 [Entamoeba invadens IP1]|uniref:tRNA (adenine(58)-N(1))-methyltransferase n=1 Tax=Entamoeba invadens IP1 TaxID=370355 RepID=A0A0A1U8A1_ENTIV|nr:hypothetical protein EIN_267970 [Entamoeba invadens IP1]ELP91061.1 hypothetical protein EIN_267970 [Entamoeba invadens IP1]|eukprot:XP_004257832.1 hypothetical protein EIN_267970 [Entamoeba invadens IP1]
MNTLEEEIHEGDHVVMYMNKNSFSVIKVAAGKIFQNKLGNFPHSKYIIGKHYGDSINTSEGSVYFLKNCPSLYTTVITHRTQVLYQETIAPVLAYFDITPDSIIVESGTGSGCLSAAFASRLQFGEVRGKGHLFTFEFHEQRKLKAQEDFNEMGFKDVITVVLRDAVKEGFVVENELAFGDADCVFLDLPNVDQAITNAYNILRPGGKICCFCPCIEQIQRSCEELKRDNRFTNLLTKENVILPYSVRGSEKKREDGMPEEVLTQRTGMVKGHVGYVTFAMKTF